MPIRNIGLDTPVSAILLQGAQALVALREKQKDREQAQKQWEANQKLQQEGLDIRKQNADVQLKNVQLQEQNLEARQRQAQLDIDKTSAEIAKIQAQTLKFLAPSAEGKDSVPSSMWKMAQAGFEADYNKQTWENVTDAPYPGGLSLDALSSEIRNTETLLADKQDTLSKFVNTDKPAYTQASDEARALSEKLKTLNTIRAHPRTQELFSKRGMNAIKAEQLLSHARKNTNGVLPDSNLLQALEQGQAEATNEQVKNTIKFPFTAQLAKQQYELARGGSANGLAKLALSGQPVLGTKEQLEQIREFSKRLAAELGEPFEDVHTLVMQSITGQ